MQASAAQAATGETVVLVTRKQLETRVTTYTAQTFWRQTNWRQSHSQNNASQQISTTVKC